MYYGILIPPMYIIYYVNMHQNYVNMRLIYINMYHNGIDMCGSVSSSLPPPHTHTHTHALIVYQCQIPWSILKTVINSHFTCIFMVLE